MFSKILTFGLFLSCSHGCPCSFNEELGEVSCDQGTQHVLPWLLPDCLSQDLYDQVSKKPNKEGTILNISFIFFLGWASYFDRSKLSWNCCWLILHVSKSSTSWSLFFQHKINHWFCIWSEPKIRICHFQWKFFENHTKSLFLKWQFSNHSIIKGSFSKKFEF